MDTNSKTEEQRRVEAQGILERLVTAAKQKAEPIKGQLITTETWVRHSASNLKRAEDGRISGYETSTQEIQKPSSFRLIRWLSEQFAKTPEFEEASSAVSRIYGLKNEHLAHPLTLLLRDMIIEKRRNGNIEIFLDDLEHRPSEWNVKIWLVGVLLESSIKLDENVTLRRIAESDLGEEVLEGEFPAGRGRFTAFYDSVLEFIFFSLYPMEVQKKIERLCILLSLFKESSSHYEMYDMRAKSYFQLGGRPFKIAPSANEPRAVIHDDEATDLAKFVQRFEPKIPEVMFGRIVDPLEIAMKRYVDSVRDTAPFEERLTTAVMGLEALFLEETSELRFRLALRTAQILKYLGENSQDVYDTVSKAYGFRSSHVHGSVLSEQDAREIQAVTNRIWRYLRKSLLFWLAEGITSEGKKKQLLKDIDSSLIDDSKSDALKGRMEAAKLMMKGAL